MPRNTKGGKGAKRGANKNQNNNQSSNDLVLSKNDKQRYGCVTKVLGDRRFMVTTDEKDQIVKVPGKYRRKREFWVGMGSTVLYDLGDLSSGGMGYVLYVYTESQVKQLKKKGEIMVINDVADDSKTELNLFDDEIEQKEETKESNFDMDDELDLDLI
jgi:initiation factor 1A